MLSFFLQDCIRRLPHVRISHTDLVHRTVAEVRESVDSPFFLKFASDVDWRTYSYGNLMSRFVTQAVDGTTEHDGAVVARLWKGDLSALGILYDRCGSLVYGIAMKGLRRVSEEEDLTQEVFLSLMRTRSYNPRRGSLTNGLDSPLAK